MVCRTASGTPRRNGSAARKTPSANSPRAMRRRRARDLPYLRLLLPYVIARTPVPQESLPELFGLPPKFIQPPVVLYHQVGPPGLLFAGELPRLYPPQRLAVHTPLRRPRPPPPFRHRNRYGVVEGAAAAALEQERYLGDEEVGARGGAGCLRGPAGPPGRRRPCCRAPGGRCLVRQGWMLRNVAQPALSSPGLRRGGRERSRRPRRSWHRARRAGGRRCSYRRRRGR